MKKIITNTISNIKIEENLIFIEKMNKIKNKAKERKAISTERFFCYEKFNIFRLCFDNNKRYIAKKTIKIVKNNLEIKELIKNHLELQFLKKLLLQEQELNLFPYQFKYLNTGNMPATKSYLDKLHLGEFQRKIPKEDIDEDGIVKR